MELPRPNWFAVAYAELLAGQNLESATVTEAFRDLLAGRVEETFAAAFLTALRMKGETASEIAAAASALREQMVRLVPVGGPVIDTCGTGGDGASTFNISTAAAFVTAGAGVPVVKHGNRAVSSSSGSADVLRELGVNLEAGPAWAQKCLDRIGFAFCYAPHFHTGMSYVARLRRKLGVRTIFNLIGPLANPAGADYQVLGVGKPELLDQLAGAVARLGVRRCVLVCSRDGLDEVSLGAPTDVRIVEGNDFTNTVWQPEELGLGEVNVDSLRVENALESAAVIRSVLSGEDGPAARVTLANAATALYAAGLFAQPSEAVAAARASIASGKARHVLDQLIALKN